MYICINCKKEMTCKKVGATAHYGHGHCYAGDIFECKECGASLMTTSCMSHQRDMSTFKKDEVIIDM